MQLMESCGLDPLPQAFEDVQRDIFTFDVTGGPKCIEIDCHTAYFVAHLEVWYKVDAFTTDSFVRPTGPRATTLPWRLRGTPTTATVTPLQTQPLLLALLDMVKVLATDLTLLRELIL